MSQNYVINWSMYIHALKKSHCYRYCCLHNIVELQDDTPWGWGFVGHYAFLNIGIALQNEQCST